MFRKDYRVAAFLKEFEAFKKLNDSRLPVSKDDLYPCLDDKTSTTHFDAHYIYHPAWAARIIQSTAPAKHVDISSTLAFCTLLSAFVPTDFYDFRPAKLDLDNLRSMPGDLTGLDLADNSIPSLSCMHTIEHVGLGRYGDPLDPEGDMKAIRELTRVCSIGGNLLVAVPVGKKRIMFNAHRIYDAEEFAGYFKDFKVIDFSLVTDDNAFINNASYQLASAQNYGCGCFWFRK